jgi:hypothetical protein
MNFKHSLILLVKPVLQILVDENVLLGHLHHAEPLLSESPDSAENRDLGISHA